VNEYTMTFVFSPDFKDVLLLRKPDDHRNPIYRGKWTAPGGLLESGESEIEGAIRELHEETGLDALADDMRMVLILVCNCDPLEAEHNVLIYATTMPPAAMKLARGSSAEPVAIYPTNILAGINIVAYLQPLISLAISRLRQPKGVPKEEKK
jgi:8-oxo-dGTP pyrophosphatase MutT (NUDIX family)